MKKKIFRIILFLITISSICTGCGNKEKKDRDSSDRNEDKKFLIQKKNIELNIGDIVTFGTYEQDNDSSNGQESIEWQVVDISDGKALLVSRYVLDNIEYNEKLW